jgi:transmembrane sensor
VQGQDIRYLFRLYKSNQISEKEMEQLFKLLEQAEYDEQLKLLLDEVWDETVPLPVKRKSHTWLKAAAVIILLIVAGGTYLGLHKTERKQLAVVNPAGHAPVKVVLEDSTVVWLNAASTITYKDPREVELKGEAFFQVTKKAASPFTVHSGKLVTRVLGTEFNISAYKEDPRIVVTVISGKVSVNSSVYLEKNQQVIYDSILVRNDHVTLNGITAWKNDDISFYSTPVPQGIRELERRFNVKIRVDEKLNKCLFFGDFSHEPLESILKMLATSVNGKLIKENAAYHLQGDGCY